MRSAPTRLHVLVAQRREIWSLPKCTFAHGRVQLCARQPNVRTGAKDLVLGVDLFEFKGRAAPHPLCLCLRSLLLTRGLAVAPPRAKFGGESACAMHSLPHHYLARKVILLPPPGLGLCAPWHPLHRCPQVELACVCVWHGATQGLVILGGVSGCSVCDAREHLHRAGACNVSSPTSAPRRGGRPAQHVSCTGSCVREHHPQIVSWARTRPHRGWDRTRSTSQRPSSGAPASRP